MKSKSNDSLRLEQQLCFALYSTSRLMIQSYDTLLEALDLTYPQYLVMLVLWETKTISVKELGIKLMLDSGTLSPLIKKLEEKNYVQKARSTEDERSVNVTLTLHGSQLQKKALKVPEAMFCRLNMKESEFVDLRNQIKALRRVLKPNKSLR